MTQLYGIVQRVYSNMPSNMLADRDVFPKLPGRRIVHPPAFGPNEMIKMPMPLVKL